MIGEQERILRLTKSERQDNDMSVNHYEWKHPIDYPEDSPLLTEMLDEFDHWGFPPIRGIAYDKDDKIVEGYVRIYYKVRTTN